MLNVIKLVCAISLNSMEKTDVCKKLMARNDANKNDTRFVTTTSWRDRLSVRYLPRNFARYASRQTVEVFFFLNDRSSNCGTILLLWSARNIFLFFNRSKSIVSSNLWSVDYYNTQNTKYFVNLCSSIKSIELQI